MPPLFCCAVDTPLIAVIFSLLRAAADYSYYFFRSSLIFPISYAVDTPPRLRYRAMRRR